MIAIDVRGLGKTYKVYRSPVDRLKEIVLRRPFHTDFVALDNVGFSVFSGATFGVIGENGAGKSTLLKILSRTLNPTSGHLSINGRVAALLELGAGFNHDLTGEENIYLNAYLLGLSKKEIDERRQDIIDFSELGDFIKRPVKTYSSGMYVRLAFSIATSVNPDILIIDEALSVGDEYFQKKCVDRMMHFRKVGKTILFCSHNMYFVQELCQKAVWIHKGGIKAIGETGKVILEYQNHQRHKSAALKEKTDDALGAAGAGCDKPVSISGTMIMNEQGCETEVLRTGENALFSFTVRCSQKNVRGHIGFAVVRNDELMCFGTTTHFDGLSPVEFKDGREYLIRMPALPLLPGMYYFLIYVADEFAMHAYDSARTPSFSIASGKKEFGLSYMDHEWVLEGSGGTAE
ncbi:MAG: ABC transporter ATP-binding protein [Nitrospirae bacterium]|nr:ABC transporter ATP-binding protein [Nitrospirota bacterium]